MEEEGILLEEAHNLVAVREAQLAVELVGIVEAEDTLGLAGEVLLRPDHEPALGVVCEDALEGGDAIGLGLERLRPRALFLLALLLEILGFW